MSQAVLNVDEKNCFIRILALYKGEGETLIQVIRASSIIILNFNIAVRGTALFQYNYAIEYDKIPMIR